MIMIPHMDFFPLVTDHKGINTPPFPFHKLFYVIGIGQIKRNKQKKVVENGDITILG